MVCAGKLSMYSSKKNFILALTAASALGMVSGRPAVAQPAMTNTLTNVQFSDGATANGFFNTNFYSSPPSYSPFDITTTSGLTDTVAGSHYISSVGSVVFSPPAFIFNTSGTTGTEFFLRIGSVLTPNTYALEPGVLYYNNVTGAVNGFSGSVEMGVGFYRTLSSGNLTLTPADAVPEASAMVSFGLLLTLGLGSAVIVARKKRSLPTSL